MSSEQPVAVLHEEPRNPGEVTLPEDDIAADNLLKELQDESLDVDELVSIAQGLGEVETTIRAMPETQTLTEPDALAINVAVEQFILAAKLEPQQVFAMEAMHSYAGRRAARKLALESVVSTIRTITEKIIAFIRKVLSFLYDTMQELLHGADAVLETARNLQQQAKGVAHKTIQGDSFLLDDERINAFFSKDGKGYDAAGVLSTYQNYCAAMKQTFSTGFIKEMGLRVGETMQEAKNGESYEATAGKVDKILQSMLGRTFKNFKGYSAKDGHELRELELPFGGRRLVLLLSLEDGLYSGFNFEIDSAPVNEHRTVESKLEVMDYSQIIALAKAVENEMLFGLFKSYKAGKSDLDRIRNDIEKGCREISKSQQATNRNSTGLTYSVGFLKDLASGLVKALSITHRYDILVARHVLMYCDRSIKRHA